MVEIPPPPFVDCPGEAAEIGGLCQRVVLIKLAGPTFMGDTNQTDASLQESSKSMENKSQSGLSELPKMAVTAGSNDQVEKESPRWFKRVSTRIYSAETIWER